MHQCVSYTEINIYPSVQRTTARRGTTNIQELRANADNNTSSTSNNRNSEMHIATLHTWTPPVYVSPYRRAGATNSNMQSVTIQRRTNGPLALGLSLFVRLAALVTAFNQPHDIYAEFHLVSSFQRTRPLEIHGRFPAARCVRACV